MTKSYDFSHALINSMSNAHSLNAEAYQYLRNAEGLPRRIANSVIEQIEVSNKSKMAFLAKFEDAVYSYIHNRVGELHPPPSKLEKDLVVIGKAATKLKQLIDDSRADKIVSETLRSLKLAAIEFVRDGRMSSEKRHSGGADISSHEMINYEADRIITDLRHSLVQIEKITSRGLRNAGLAKGTKKLESRRVSAAQSFTDEVVSLYFKYRGRDHQVPRMGGQELEDLVLGCLRMINAEAKISGEFVKRAAKSARRQQIRNRIKNAPAYKAMSKK